MISKKALLIAVGLAFVGTSAFAAESITLNAIRQGNEAFVKRFEAAKEKENRLTEKTISEAKEAQNILNKSIEESQKELATQNRESTWYKERIDVGIKNLEMASKTRKSTLAMAQKNLGEKIGRHNKLLATIRANKNQLQAAKPTL